jgi:hypothetical protein
MGVYCIRIEVLWECPRGRGQIDELAQILGACEERCGTAGGDRASHPAGDCGEPRAGNAAGGGEAEILPEIWKRAESKGRSLAARLVDRRRKPRARCAPRNPPISEIANYCADGRDLSWAGNCREPIYLYSGQ